MRSLIVILIIVLSINLIKAYADGDSFGIRIMPQKLIENSDGILQIYSLHNGQIHPQRISNLTYSSTDSSIIQIVGIENTNDTFITDIKLKTVNHGNAKIELAASGFASQEVPITVYGNENYPVKLLVQSTPSIFSSNGPHTGYITTELINNNGSPAIAKDDTIVSLTTTNDKIVAMTDNHIIIKAGEYYGVGRFTTNQVGTAQIFASSDSLEPSSATITVNQTSSSTIKLYVYPQKINDYQASTAYAIAQLTDSSGNPASAKEDITIPIRITDPNANLTNSSPIIQNIEANSPIVIKKGEYWGYTNIAVKAAANGTYNVFTAAPNGYINSVQSQITASMSKFYDDKSARLDLLPILATGKKELIGVIHLEDKNGNPIIASHDLQIEIDSSDSNSLSVDDAILKRGSSVALVFGKTGTSIPTSLFLHVVTYNDQTVSPVISLPMSNSFKLVAQPMIQEILSNTNFPVALYQIDASGASTYFSNDSIIKTIPNDYVIIPQTIVHNGESVLLINSSSVKTGTSNTNIFSDKYQTSMTVQTISNLPSQVVLDYPDPVVDNMKNTIMVQILDSDGNPVFAQKDIVLKLISSNRDVLSLPKSITVLKGQYYATLNIIPNSNGTSQISILADNIPLSTYKVTVDNLSPTLSLTVPNSTLSGETFIASITAKEHNEPLKNMRVQWTAKGAIIQSSDGITNENGTANITLLPNSDDVKIDANVTGLEYPTSHISKIVRINNSTTKTADSNSTSSNTVQIGTIQSDLKALKVNGVDTLPILILSSIAIGGVLIKKKNLFANKKIPSNPNIKTK
ncbi:MAG: hypothetical protein ABI342_09515 [Nitrososphaera sp.]